MNLAQKIRWACLKASINAYKLTMDASYPKDPNPENWRTIQGAKVHLVNGKIDGGAGGKFMGNEWHGKKPHGHNSFFPPKGWKKPEPAPEPQKSEKKWGNPPKGIINKLSGKYKNAGEEVQTDVNEAIKDGKAKVGYADLIKSVVASDLGTMPESDETELALQTIQAYKDKKITKLAAQNVLAAIAQKNSVMTQALIKHWSDPTSEMWTPSTMPEPKPKKAKGNELSDTDKLIVENYAKHLEVTKGYENILKSVESLFPYATAAEQSQITNAFQTYHEIEDLTGNKQKDLLDDAKKIMQSAYMKQKKAVASSNSKANKKYKDLADKLDTTSSILAKMDMLEEAGYDINAQGEIVNKFQTYQTHKKAGKVDAEKYKNEALQLMKKYKPNGSQSKNQQNQTKEPYYDFSDENTGIKTAPGTQQVFDYSVSKDFADKYGKAQMSKTSYSEANSIRRYTAGSKHLRDWLVYGRTDDNYKDSFYTKGMTGKAMQEACDEISKGLKKMEHPDMWTSRNCSLMDWATQSNQNGVTYEDLQKMVKSGKVFENKAFISTAPIKEPDYGDTSVIRRFYVPQKAVAGYIASGSDYPHEQEFLLDKGTKTRIMKVEKDSSGRIYTYEEVVLDD